MKFDLTAATRSDDFRTSVASALLSRHVHYTRIDIAKCEADDTVRFLVDHGGERRRVNVAGVAVALGGMPVFLDGARRAIELAAYLDELRQGMRDLVDQ